MNAACLTGEENADEMRMGAGWPGIWFEPLRWRAGRHFPPDRIWSCALPSKPTSSILTPAQNRYQNLAKIPI